MSHNGLNLEQIKDNYGIDYQKAKQRVIICAGTGCVANGSLKLYQEFLKQITEQGLSVTVDLKEEKEGVFISKSGCQGFCQMGPLVTILPSNILYTKVKIEDVAQIVEKTLKNNEIVYSLVYHKVDTHEQCPHNHDIPFYKNQHRFVLKECGMIDPEDIREYIYNGGYSSALRVYRNMSAEDVCREILASGLRGRGGGGFLTGKKWEVTRLQKEKKKYVICNGDEGDPGAFMDRSLMEGDPHRVIEGMIIAAYAIGADEGYIYVRAEYPLAVKRMRKAVADAVALGVLGENIFGTNFTFNLHVMEGAGAFVCGEETALIASIEGDRGMPRAKPPFPAQSGLKEKPTVINNVETLATVPLILSMGVEQYKQIGVETSSGTKTFAVTGHVANTGLIEVPFGTTLREIVYDIAGGVTLDDGSLCPEAFKAVQIGGPSGACLTKEHLDLSLDFDSLRQAGAMVGSGGLVVMNKNTCMVEVARFFLNFTQNESCGKCVPCREGTKQLLRILEKIIQGQGTLEDLNIIEELAIAIKDGSLCGLGKTAPNPILSTLKYFRDEYLAHIVDKKCPAGVCTALKTILIKEAACKGCTKCVKVCPVNAISGSIKKVHVIDQKLCIKCGACLTVCPFKAIVQE